MLTFNQGLVAFLVIVLSVVCTALAFRRPIIINNNHKFIGGDQSEFIDSDDDDEEITESETE